MLTLETFSKSGFFAVATALALTPALAVADTVVIEPSSHDEVITDSVDSRMFASGLTTFAVAYGASVIVASTSDRPSNERLYIPIAGPWLALADRDSDCDGLITQRCDNETTTKILLVADGVFQGVGVLAMLEGVLNPTTHVIHRTTTAKRSIDVSPTSVHGQPGFAVFGRW